MRNLLFLIGMTIPFPAIGLELANGLFLSPPMLFGTLYAGLFLIATGVHRMHLVAAAMLFVFALTAVPRFPPASYLLSIAALAIAIAPLTAPVNGIAQWSSLKSGFLWGLNITLSIVAVELLAQLLHITVALDLLQNIFVHGNPGSFLNYLRPKAGFLEPAHLAIYLGFAYVTLDQLHGEGSGKRWLQIFVLLAIGLTGSLSGIAIMLMYFLVNWSQKVLPSLRKSIRKRTVIFLITGSVIVLIVVSLSQQQIGDVMNHYLERLIRAAAAIEQGSLVGSEGSRINAFLALPNYWSQSGLAGFLFGTGYANYETWLIENYGHLGVWSTFGRGQLDSIAIAVFLSTGLSGLVAYGYFTVSVFLRSRLSTALGVQAFLVIVNFAFGFLVLYLYWYLLFVLSAALRIRHTGTRYSVSESPLHSAPASSN